MVGRERRVQRTGSDVVTLGSLLSSSMQKRRHPDFSFGARLRKCATSLANFHLDRSYDPILDGRGQGGTGAACGNEHLDHLTPGGQNYPTCLPDACINVTYTSFFLD